MKTQPSQPDQRLALLPFGHSRILLNELRKFLRNFRIGLELLLSLLLSFIIILVLLLYYYHYYYIIIISLYYYMQLSFRILPYKDNKNAIQTKYKIRKRIQGYRGFQLLGPACSWPEKQNKNMFFVMFENG